jgi:hypothetical protein
MPNSIPDINPTNSSRMHRVDQNAALGSGLYSWCFWNLGVYLEVYVAILICIG